MGDLFNNLCKGPVVVIDDAIAIDGGDKINDLIKIIEDNKLPVLKYNEINDAKDKLKGLLFSNFIILDWLLSGERLDSAELVQTGEAAEEAITDQVVDFIRKIREICLAPIFVLSNLDKGEIEAKLKRSGIITEDKNYVFVENKNTLCEDDALILKIETWIRESPHICLSKTLINKWLLKSMKVFWDLYELNSDWPALFHKSFEEEQDPILALRDTLFQLVYSEINISDFDSSLLNFEREEISEESDIESLKNLIKRLLYIKHDIDKDICPGDIFKMEDGTYRLNIRPECDTTRRTRNPEVYLLKGEIKTPDDLRKNYDRDHGIIPKENQIILEFLDENNFVIFNKKKLEIKKYNEVKSKKICRVASPFINRYIQSYSSYLGRFGVPNYPRQAVDSLFKSKDEKLQKLLTKLKGVGA